MDEKNNENYQLGMLDDGFTKPRKTSKGIGTQPRRVTFNDLLSVFSKLS